MFQLTAPGQEDEENPDQKSMDTMETQLMDSYWPWKV